MKSGTRTTKLNLDRHKKRCSNGTLYCTQCPIFSTTSQADLIYHIAKKQPIVPAKNTSKSQVCLEDFSGFYAVRNHRSSQRGIAVKTSNLDMETLLEDKMKQNSILAIISSLTLSLKKVDIVFSLSPCHPSTTPFWTRNCIVCSSNWNLFNVACQTLLPKSTLHSNLFWKTLKMERVDTFVHTENTVTERSKLVCIKDDMTNLKEIAENGCCWPLHKRKSEH